MRVAGVDAGTNSMRLLIADVVDGQLTDVVRRMEVVRLGEGVDRTGRLDAAALERAFAMAREYHQQCRDSGVAAVRFVATSATRDAINRADFVTGIHEIFGVAPEVISGTEEAELALTGTVGSLRDQPGPYLVVDIGGGSTELVLGTTTPAATFSMNVGCVRIFERHLHTDPPTAAEIAAAAGDIGSELAVALTHVPAGAAATLVGTAGTVTTITAHALGLNRYDPDQIDGAVLGSDDVLAACADLLRMDRRTRAGLGFMHPGRADVIGAGALVWDQVIRAVRHELALAGRKLETIVTSEHDILDGITMSAVRRIEPRD